MAGSRAAWENQTGESDQSAPPLTPKERKANAQNKDRMIDRIPGDKGSTVDKTRTRNQKMKEAIEQE